MCNGLAGGRWWVPQRCVTPRTKRECDGLGGNREQFENREGKAAFHGKKEGKCARCFKYRWLEQMRKNVLQQAGAAGGQRRAEGVEAAQVGSGFKMQTEVPFAQRRGSTSEVLAEKFLW